MSVFTRLIKYYNKIYNYMLLSKEKVSFEKDLAIGGRLYLENRGGRITIGQGTKINSSIENNPIGGSSHCIIVVEKQAEIYIGNYVGISNAALVAMQSIRIENNVMIGGGVCIYDSDFHSLQYEKRICKVDNDFIKKPVVIKEGAFIGAHSIILKGVTIGRHAIIGAGSVVTKSVPDHEIWAGNPAKKVKDIL